MKPKPQTNEFSGLPGIRMGDGGRKQKQWSCLKFIKNKQEKNLAG